MLRLVILLIKFKITFFLVLLGFLLGLIFPLAKKREYLVLGINENVVVAGEKMSVINLTEVYKPIILQEKNLRGPIPTHMYFEVISDNDNYLNLIYRVVWNDEIHPKFIINILYKIFRKFYFGSKIDIEIILLKIDKSSEEIIEIKYESDSSNDPNVFKSDHALVVYKKTDESRYTQYLNGKKIKETEIFTQNSIEGKKQLILPVLTWNHVFCSNIGKLTIEQEESEYKEYNLPVSPLTDKIFKRYRFDRRSWIDYGCSINKKLPLIIGSISGITVGILCNFLFLL